MNLLTRSKPTGEYGAGTRDGNPNRRWRTVRLAALVLPVAVAGVTLGCRWMRPPPTLGLNVTRKDGQLLVHWDHQGPQILRARRAVLAIRDGTYEQHIDLDAPQLRRGSLAYMSAGADIQVRLEVFPDSGRSLSESVRLLQPRAAGSPDLGSPPVPAHQKTSEPLDAAYYYKLGREQTSRNDLEAALQSLNRAIELDPRRAVSYNARGYVYLRRQSYASAIVEFSEAIRLRPDYVNAFENRAVARRHLGDDAGAAEDNQRAAELAQPPG